MLKDLACSKTYGQAKNPNFYLLSAWSFLFFMISDAENKLLGILIININDTEALEELPAC